MKKDLLILILWLSAILFAAVSIYIVRLKLFHKIRQKEDFKKYTTTFLITILGTAVGFAFVTVTTIYLNKIDEKEEILSLLGNVFKELDINHKVLSDRIQMTQPDISQSDLELHDRFSVDIPVQFNFVEDLYRNRNTYKYLSESFTKNRLVILYRGINYSLRKADDRSLDYKDNQIKKLAKNFALYQDWINKEGIKIAGNEEGWKKSVKLFETWDQLTLLYLK